MFYNNNYIMLGFTFLSIHSDKNCGRLIASPIWNKLKSTTQGTLCERWQRSHLKSTVIASLTEGAISEAD